jgi:low affinity Fe/Cu permease
LLSEEILLHEFCLFFQDRRIAQVFDLAYNLYNNQYNAEGKVFMRETKKRKKKIKSPKVNFFEKFAHRITELAGSTAVFCTALGLIILWLVTGPFFGFSNTWQLMVNTATTIITFLMVFLIQKTQNKDALSVHIKLNELIMSNANAKNRLIAAEELTEEELRILEELYIKIAKKQREKDQNK